MTQDEQRLFLEVPVPRKMTAAQEDELKKAERLANTQRGVMIFDMYDEEDEDWVIVPDGDGIILKRRSEIEEEE